ncbi:MAG: ester cyclase [Propionibacteriales bacterium]|nr:ester cyclase [Propionibacteriales bacterium]
MSATTGRADEVRTMVDTPLEGNDMAGSDNKAAARKVLEEIFPANDEAALREVISDEFVNHEAPPGTPPGLGGITMFMHLLNEAFSQQRWEIHDVVAEGDTVVVRCTHSGVHTGQFFDLPASGRRFSYNQMHMLRMRDSKAAKHWAVRDDASLMRQLTA